MGRHADAASSLGTAMPTETAKQVERALLISSLYQMPFLAITLVSRLPLNVHRTTSPFKVHVHKFFSKPLLKNDERICHNLA